MYCKCFKLSVLCECGLPDRTVLRLRTIHITLHLELNINQLSINGRGSPCPSSQEVLSHHGAVLGRLSLCQHECVYPWHRRR